VRGLSGGPIEDDLVSGLKDREWLVRNWLSSPAHPAHPAHPAIRFGRESDGLWLLSQSAKPWSLPKFRRSPVRKTLLRTGNPSYIIHHTSYRPKVAGGETREGVMSAICSERRSVTRAKRINRIPPYTYTRESAIG
jgi:hypothetical protein